MASIVNVPAIADMDDRTFVKHMNFRHKSDLLIPLSERDSTVVLDFARACHNHWHGVNPETYDHEHLEES